MRVTGIIAEYDPFHNGHAYHLEQARRITEAEAVVAVISGHMTQRGAMSFYGKDARTKAALAGGADLVLELPYIYACNAGSEFSFGGAAVLNSLGVVTDIVFGSECDDISLLKKAAELGDGQQDPLLAEMIRKKIKSGMSYPAAFSQSAAETGDSRLGEVFQQPNNVLGIGYIRALSELGSGIVPHCVARKGSSHSQAHLTAAEGGEEPGYRKTILSVPGEQIGESDEKMKVKTASGTALRKAVREGRMQEAAGYMPDSSADIFRTEKFFGGPEQERLYSFLRYRLLTAEPEHLSRIYSVTEGIENRMKSAALSSETFEEYMRNVKTKRYTWAQIQRMNIHILMDFTSERYKRLRGTSYARVLGFSDRGSKLLRQIRKKGETEVVSNLSGLSHFSERTAEALSLEIRAGDLRNMILDRSVEGFSERRFVPVRNNG